MLLSAVAVRRGVLASRIPAVSIYSSHCMISIAYTSGPSCWLIQVLLIWGLSISMLSIGVIVQSKLLDCYRARSGSASQRVKGNNSVRLLLLFV
jgi:hypothetical protein